MSHYHHLLDRSSPHPSQHCQDVCKMGNDSSSDDENQPAVPAKGYPCNLPATKRTGARDRLRQSNYFLIRWPTSTVPKTRRSAEDKTILPLTEKSVVCTDPQPAVTSRLSPVVNNKEKCRRRRGWPFPAAQFKPGRHATAPRVNPHTCHTVLHSISSASCSYQKKKLP